MIIPYFLPNLSMGVGGTPVVFIVSSPFSAYVTTCIASAGGACSCTGGS